MRKTAFTAIAGVTLALIGLAVFAALNPPSRSSAPSLSASVGQRAPAFAVTSIDGVRYSSEALQGNPFILFAFFGGCGECIPEGQALTKIRREYAQDGLEVLAIDILEGEPLEALHDFRNLGGIDIPIVEYNGDIVAAYGLTRPDMTYIIDREGVIRYRDEHSTDYLTLDTALNDIL